MSFRALLLTRDEEFDCSLVELDEAELPDRAVKVDVEYSTVNYKDALAVLDRGRIVREWPLVPGIDLAGVVTESSDPAWSPGDRVVVNGWELGETRWGGLAERAALDAAWLTRLPAGLTNHDAAAIGTAGYTAMLCVMALEDHDVRPGGGPVVVTGAAGGVGSVAVALLAAAGFEVVASTGRADTEGDYLRSLGAADVVDRDELARESRPLEGARWAGAVDTVGGAVLANLLKTMAYEGTVAACGLAGGIEVNTTVMPFILRGVRLVGVESVYQPLARREAVWQRLAQLMPSERLAEMSRVVTMAQVPEVAAEILDGRVRGRTVVDVKG